MTGNQEVSSFLFASGLLCLLHLCHVISIDTCLYSFTDQYINILIHTSINTLLSANLFMFGQIDESTCWYILISTSQHLPIYWSVDSSPRQLVDISACWQRNILLYIDLSTSEQINMLTCWYVYRSTDQTTCTFCWSVDLSIHWCANMLTRILLLPYIYGHALFQRNKWSSRWLGRQYGTAYYLRINSLT